MSVCNRCAVTEVRLRNHQEGFGLGRLSELATCALRVIVIWQLAKRLSCQVCPVRVCVTALWWLAETGTTERQASVVGRERTIVWRWSASSVYAYKTV